MLHRDSIPTRPAALTIRLLGLSSLLAVATGCGQPDVLATFDASETQKYQSCLERLFPVEATFTATRQRIDSTGFLWMTNTRATYDTDLIYLEIFDRQAARTSNDSPVSFQYVPETTDQPARMEVHPEQSCPDLNVSLVVNGSVRFQSFSDQTGEVVTGQLTSGTILDARTGETVAESFTGEWDFEVTGGYPAQFYPSYDSDEYKRNP